MTERFTETLSTGIVTDNVTGKEYKCEMRIDDDLLKLLNELSNENEQLKQENKSLIQGIKDTAKQGADTITAVWESKNRPTTMNKGYYDR